MLPGTAPSTIQVSPLLWDTEAHPRRALAEYGGAFLKALASVAPISTGARRPISVWHVNTRA